jgi:TMEM175 potassium channel family protein
MSKARTEAFSDAVIAVAITLLALDLRVPEPTEAASLAHQLGEQWPNYVAYVISFITIGIIRINHHAMLRRITAVDHTILVLNLLLLLTIGVLPFSTALMARYLTEAHGEHLAAAVWAASFLVMSPAVFVMQRHLLVAKADLVHERLGPTVRRWVLRRNALGLLPYAIATLGFIVSPYLTLAICSLVAGFYALPATTIDASELAGGRDAETAP